ncbi:PopZ family protein [Mesorhizobium australicum]|uniref:DUF2497 domain-containing protein n=1 Tax=Mesorhizobium australicum TaxID=536018 RepID=A0A1X7PF67_9HYPH|nr:DUF2497 domain-containing protein [Mesorhizobium australicum]SMH49085.1 hypothetical protein SAMN02982922_3843 [Mesorhizobium australicum]
MEEILASIRRIIEDSDSGRSAEDNIIPPAANTSSPGAERGDIDAFREEFRGAGRPAEIVEPAAQAPRPAVPAQPAPAAVDRPVPAATRTERPLQTAHVEPVSSPATQPDWKQRLATPAGVEPAPVTQGAASEAARTSIISDVAGRQVAAAFGELSDAFAASRRRSFDEIAEEMIRPMLQEWLDNNLPTLVERLVREEIERVARGAAR